MAGLKVILTGATGMVGEGVLFACLESPEVERVLLVSRRHYDLAHPKLSELLLKNFAAPAGHEQALSGYDACFFCAGVSSLGKSEAQYTALTYDLTVGFAAYLARLNPGLRFVYVSGQGTDSSEHGRRMWARVKGRTENALMKLPLGRVYAFRPGIMSPTRGQKSLKRWLAPFDVPVRGARRARPAPDAVARTGGTGDDPRRPPRSADRRVRDRGHPRARDVRRVPPIRTRRCR